MAFTFYKYQGTGNDFIIIDHRSPFFSKNDTEFIARLCDRRFGIGADGLLLLEQHPDLDFRMVYYNSDGQLSSMCGNGGRCLVHFARELGIIDKTARFEAVDGIHSATIMAAEVSLEMKDVDEVRLGGDYVFLDTGSPHHVTIVNQLGLYDVKEKGRRIRFDLYGEEGANVNFVEQLEADLFSVRTYERGVEDETLSCGTGVTAVAIAMHAKGITSATLIGLQTPGGSLSVSFDVEGNSYKNVYLKGPAKMVYKGEWS